MSDEYKSVNTTKYLAAMQQASIGIQNAIVLKVRALSKAMTTESRSQISAEIALLSGMLDGIDLGFETLGKHYEDPAIKVYEMTPKIKAGLTVPLPKQSIPVEVMEAKMQQPKAHLQDEDKEPF